MNFLLVIVCLFTSTAFAAEDLQIVPGTMIEVGKWDSQTHTFEIKILANRALGPFYCTPETLFHGNKALNPRKVKSDPHSLEGLQYQVDGEISIATEYELAARRKRFINENFDSTAATPGPNSH